MRATLFENLVESRLSAGPGGRLRAVPMSLAIHAMLLTGVVKLLRGLPLLDQAAIEAVKQWLYTPTLLSGVPVPVVMTVTVNFRLSSAA